MIPSKDGSIDRIAQIQHPQTKTQACPKIPYHRFHISIAKDCLSWED